MPRRTTRTSSARSTAGSSAACSPGSTATPNPDSRRAVPTATTTASPASEVARAYLDHASTSALRPAALEAMLPYLAEHHADPGRLHAEGRVTRVAVEQAREQVAAAFGARPREVVFTSSGTEAINTAVWGALARAPGNGVVTTAVEHSAVLDATGRAPVEPVVVGVDDVGRFDPVAVLDAVDSSIALVSVQLANHEVGTVQPVAEIVAGCRERGVLCLLYT